MFSKVLIANRGAIAVRICRTLKSLGVRSVAVYSDADRDSLHRLAADEAYPLGDGSAATTYLNQEVLLDIMGKAGVDAVHPGYGFLSENPEFVKACEERDIVFIGPTTEQMQQFSLKHSARALAAQQKIPLLNGSDLLDSADAAQDAAQHLGYPVMLKSTAGGGGIGMQICHDPEQLSDCFDSVRRLSGNNFANDGVFIERFIAQARHIEVQVFGDGQGQVISLGERDCSAQRRNQKVLEETPAPGLTDTVRAALHQAAVTLMRAVKYRNAGTVEFIFDEQSQQFWFLEVNTRLQVEHGVTEQIFGVDLVDWMVRLAAGTLPPLSELQLTPPTGHSIQARLYAEDPNKQFQPSAGLLTHVDFPEQMADSSLRIDTWVQAGIEVSALYDPMLAKVIVKAPDRSSAIKQLDAALAATTIEGIETNRAYLQAVLKQDVFLSGRMHTRFLNDFTVAWPTIDVITPGTLTTMQDYPGRVGFWHVGVPPSGPFDGRSFRLGNRLLGNHQDAAGLEITVSGPRLRFNQACSIVLTGASLDAALDGEPVPLNTVVRVSRGSTLVLGTVTLGARSYLCVSGGLASTAYLGSRSTFTLGQFGGHGGRSLRSGDVLHLALATPARPSEAGATLPAGLAADLSSPTVLRVMYGPHGAPDFFTPGAIREFFATEWVVHYNSSRTGIRLLGPKPKWARSDGGEAGMHPSNIHDNAYAIGTVDFTGDMPVILGPDGPSLGGFVCPVTVIHADLWKLGQLKPGATLRFSPVSQEQADQLARAMENEVTALEPEQPDLPAVTIESLLEQTPVVRQSVAAEITYRAAGDRYLLVEFGDPVLDIRLRLRAHALMQWMQSAAIDGVLELTPGIRSLQIHYNSLVLPRVRLLEKLEQAEHSLANIDDLVIPSRTVYLPLSWDDSACQEAIEKYMQSVRADAPWCPSNLEFIRRINGLASIEAVKKTVFDASYLVLGLGDVYLGAPVATPIDPRHRLVTTKYNPARTWTAENSVGIGGAYLCVYGMEGPGGYQFVGRTLQMWNRYRQTPEFSQPWLLRFFDQIRFVEVTADELATIRQDFPNGRYPLRIEHQAFRLSDYQRGLDENRQEIETFIEQRNLAFNRELQRWVDNNQMEFESEPDPLETEAESHSLPEDVIGIDSQVAGTIWKVVVQTGQTIQAGDTVVVLESMKMEIAVESPTDGTIVEICREQGKQISAGQRLVIIRPT